MSLEYGHGTVRTIGYHVICIEPVRCFPFHSLSRESLIIQTIVHDTRLITEQSLVTGSCNGNVRSRGPVMVIEFLEVDSRLDKHFIPALRESDPSHVMHVGQIHQSLTFFVKIKIIVSYLISCIYIPAFLW